MINLLTTVIIDDMELEGEDLQMTINKTELFREKPAIYSDVLSAKKELMKRELPIDFIFCDIEMDDISGIEAYAILRPYCKFFVFCTNHTKYSLEAFDLHADGYLIKPVTEEKIIDMVNLFRERQLALIVRPIKHLLLDGLHKSTDEAKRKLYKVKISKISHFKKEGNYVYAYGNLIDISTKKFENLGVFDGDLKTFIKKYRQLYYLVQINRSVILNMNWVEFHHDKTMKIKGVEFITTTTFKMNVLKYMKIHTPNSIK